MLSLASWIAEEAKRSKRLQALAKTEDMWCFYSGQLAMLWRLSKRLREFQR